MIQSDLSLLTDEKLEEIQRAVNKEIKNRESKLKLKEDLWNQAKKAMISYIEKYGYIEIFDEENLITIYEASSFSDIGQIKA